MIQRPVLLTDYSLNSLGKISNFQQLQAFLSERLKLRMLAENVGPFGNFLLVDALVDALIDLVMVDNCLYRYLLVLRKPADVAGEL